MSGILEEERERFVNSTLEQSQTVQVLQEPQVKNENLTMFNGRPTFDALVTDYQAGNRMVTVSSKYLIELVEFFEKQTGMNVSQSLNSYKHSLEVDEKIKAVEKENLSLHYQLKETILENQTCYREIENLQARQNNNGIVKLSVGKVNMFLSLCQPSEIRDDEFFYVKVEDGLMTRITRSKDSL